MGTAKSLTLVLSVMLITGTVGPKSIQHATELIGHLQTDYWWYRERTTINGTPVPRTLARYLWGKDLSGDQTPVPETPPSQTLARYLWDKDETAGDQTSGVYLWDKELTTIPETRASQTLARYLWDEEEVPENTPGIYLWDKELTTIPEASATRLLARYLWDKDEATDGSNTHGVYLWDKELTTIPEASTTASTTRAQARYLWDKEEVLENIPGIYLWDKELTTIPEPSATRLLARYLWDKDEATDGSNTHGVYLWDKELTTIPEAPVTRAQARYLWDKEEVLENIPGIYLWDKELTTIPEPSATRLLARYLWDKDEATDGSNTHGVYLWDKELTTIPELTTVPGTPASRTEKDYILVAKNLSKLKTDLAGLNAEIIEEFAMINAVGVRLNTAQVNAIKGQSNIISLMADQGVRTASLKVSAKGDPELVVSGNKVSWTLYNLGDKTLNFKRLKLAWPATNGSLERVEIGGETVFDNSASHQAKSNKKKGKSKDEGKKSFADHDTADLGIKNSRLKTHDPSKITLVFGKAADKSSEGYSLSALFQQGFKVDFAYLGSLPLQGERRDTFFPTLVDADMLHVEGVTGDGIGVAIIDTGSWNTESITTDTVGEHRVVAYYDAIQNRTSLPLSDENGHGTHIASILASSRTTLDLDGNVPGSYHGIAPDARLVIVRAFDRDGNGTYMNVIRAIAYVVAHKDKHNIRVLNLSFSATPTSHYWQDPLNLAVMAAWRAGIVVIVSAGNLGPDPMTIGVPANTPYVVTVGAITDHYTPDEFEDDYLVTFSSSGPTLEGFIKPEIVAPGGHMMGLMSGRTTIAKLHPEFHDGYSYFLMSGTSQASAVTSGIVALMLEENPALTPEDVKCRLMASARAATTPDGSLSYSVFQQGAGLVNAWDAVFSEAADCANMGLDLDKDLAGLEHYGGPANVDAYGVFYLTTTEGFNWNTDETEPDGYFWNGGYFWENLYLSYLWNTAYVWNTSVLEQNGSYWSLSDFESNDYDWDLSQLEQEGYIWNLSDTENAGYIWNLGASENAGYIWNLGAAENAGYIWNLGAAENAGYIWNLGAAENAGYIWNLGAAENAGYIWNLSDAENAGYIWNLSEAVNAGYIWNLGTAENTGYIWNLSSAQNAGYIWNLSSAENAGYIWNLSSAENAGYIWNLSVVENTGNVSDIGTAGVNKWVIQE